tara:strand:+ start:24080 stop:24649 length:570 start_codon:yes stop_codon:yes gene_type:complete
MMKLASFSSRNFDRGAPRIKEAAWLFLSGVLVESWLPGSGWRCWLLRRFGATVGERVTIKPRFRVKFPWRLSMEDDVWIGEAVWIDNLGMVFIGHDTCISQGAYLCTGSHDWAKSTFDLIVRPIVVSSHAWIGAMTRLGPGTHVGEGAVVTMGTTVSGNLEAYQVFASSVDGAKSAKPRRLDKPVQKDI